MPNGSAVSSGIDFVTKIQDYCQQSGWQAAELDETHAVLRFVTEGKRTQTLYMIRYASVLEFSVPSLAAFDSQAAVPHFFSTLLLKRNARNKIGFWCIEEIGGKQVFSYMHNANLDQLTSDYFLQVVQTCVKECEDFELLLRDKLNQ
jgi:hypothetical protein